MPEPGAPARFDLMRYYSFPVGYSVLITGGVATPYPGQTVPTTDQINAADAGSGEAGKAYFIGGKLYTVTGAEVTALNTAGYAISQFGDGFGEDFA